MVRSLTCSYVIQNGGANLMVLASALSYPLSQIFFSLKPLVGSSFQR
jgi:hypothetical protein